MAKEQLVTGKMPRQRYDLLIAFPIRKKTWTLLTTAYTLGGDTRKGGGVYGYTDHKKQLIVIDGTLPPDQFDDTLYHEVSHAFDKYETETKVLNRGNAMQAAMSTVRGAIRESNRQVRRQRSRRKNRKRKTK